MDDLSHFKATYITECFELLEDMEDRLTALDENDPDLEDVNAIFRCAHSIKGGAGAFGFDRITSFTHILEGLLDAMREGNIPVTREAIDLLLSSADILHQMVTSSRDEAPIPEDLDKEVSEMLKEIASGGGVEVEDESGGGDGEEEAGDGFVEQSFYDISFVGHENLYASGNEPLLLLKELSSFGDAIARIDVSKVPPLENIEPENCYLSWKISFDSEKKLEDVQEVFEFVEDECDLAIEKTAGIILSAPPENNAKDQESKGVEPVAEKKPEPAPEAEKSSHPAAAAPTVSSIRVDVSKVDRLVNMVGEIVITQAMIASQAKNLNLEAHFNLLSGIEQLSQHTIELQEAVMSVRMQPVKSVFSRMPRVVRDLSKQLNKDIRMETEGEATELDKTVIEQLTDPLMHMIRNSVDHGIEGPEERKAAGKKPQGTIKLSAEHRGGRIVITIKDDGNGVNRERVLGKAVEKGLVAADANLSDEEIDQLIFMAGFSTAEEVSNISGRGVGMDVVRRNIEALGGTVNLENNPGKGSTFYVTLPLTLAILDGMIVRVGKEFYIIPISNIIETMRPSKEHIKKIADGNDTINVRGEFVSLVYLEKLFNIKDAIKDASEALVILLENGSEHFGLVVDELVGQQQVVIKSLEENSDPIPGIAAATILGDGKVSLILDVSMLHEMVFMDKGHQSKEINQELAEVN